MKGCLFFRAAFIAVMFFILSVGFGSVAWAVDNGGDGYHAGPNDCDDSDPLVYLGAPEYCNSIDDDCDSVTDESASLDALVWYDDGDSDTYGDLESPQRGCTQPSGYVTNYNDCNDANSAIKPGASETCNDVDNNCSCYIGLLAGDWEAVASGGSFSLGLKTAGTLWAWGYNAYGQLGIDNTTNQSSPVQVGVSSNWAWLSAGSNHSAAINDSGELYTWGRNANGQLGHDDTSDRDVPTKVGADTNWSKVSAGVLHTLAVKTNGNLYSWGYNANGQLGLNDTTDRDVPVQITGSSSWAQVLACQSFSFAIRSNGDLYSWGSNNEGQLGLGNTTEYDEPQSVSANWLSLACGEDHAVGLKTNGTLWAWGLGDFGQLGQGDANDHTSPVQIGSATNWVSVGASGDTSFAINNSGELYSWGDNTSGVLGYGTQASVSYNPDIVKVGTQTTWYDIRGGTSSNALTLKSDDTLWAWGQNTYGQVGDGSTTARYSPVLVTEDLGYCDTHPDESDANDATTYYQDSDADGYGNSGVSMNACSQPDGYVANSTDCNDASASINPGITEVCGDGIDNNCANGIDEESASPHVTWYRDLDNDLYGNINTTTTACAKPTGYVANNTDCNDSYSTDNPAGTETCDGRDNDCDSYTDEGFSANFGTAQFGTMVFGGCSP